MAELITDYTDPAEVDLTELPVYAHNYHNEDRPWSRFEAEELSKLDASNKRADQLKALVVHHHPKKTKCVGKLHQVYA